VNKESQRHSRIGPFKFLLEVLGCIERLLNEVRHDGFPLLAACARLVVLCFLLTGLDLDGVCSAKFHRPRLLKIWESGLYES
jgi:hypothetical protein